jgi:hypothetical protein
MLTAIAFNVVLEYATRKAKNKTGRVGIELNGTHKLLAYTDDVFYSQKLSRGQLHLGYALRWNQTITFRILPLHLLYKNLEMIKIYHTTIFPAVLYGCETWILT